MFKSYQTQLQLITKGIKLLQTFVKALNGSVAAFAKKKKKEKKNKTGWHKQIWSKIVRRVFLQCHFCYVPTTRPLTCHCQSMCYGPNSKMQSSLNSESEKQSSPVSARCEFHGENNGDFEASLRDWTSPILTGCFEHFRCGTLTCRLSFSCGISILNLWTGSKSCCWLNWCCCCCNEVGCCNPGWGIGPPGCCWDAIFTDYTSKPEEDVLYIRFVVFQYKIFSFFSRPSLSVTHEPVPFLCITILHLYFTY